MGVTLLQFEQAVSEYEDAAYGKENGFIDVVRRQAGRALADKIMREASLYRRIDPDKDDPHPLVRHRWKIGVETNLSELEARERDMDAARRAGMREAAKMARRAAHVYDRVPHGGCTHVLKNSLLEIAKDIETAASE